MPRVAIDLDEALARVADELDRGSDLPSALKIITQAARRLTGADGACFVLNEGETCYYVEVDAIGPLWQGERFERRACISGWVMEHGQPVVIEDIYLDQRIPFDLYRSTFVHSLLAVPVGTLAAIGALTNYWQLEHRATPQQIEALQRLARLTAEAFEQAPYRAALADLLPSTDCCPASAHPLLAQV